MFRNASFYTLCIICLFLSSCVSKGRYTELETSLGTTETQLKERNEALSDLQARHHELQSDNAGLSGTIEELTHNLDQARSDIREKQGALEELTDNLGKAESVIGHQESTIGDLRLNLGKAESVVWHQESTIGDLRLNLGEAESAIQQKDSTIGDLRLDLGQTQGVVRQKELAISELDRTRREIETSLKEQIAQKDVKIEEIEGMLKVTFVDKILFDSGSTKIKEKGKEILMTLAESLVADTDNTIVVEGHTDNVDIRWPLRERFPSNWELSTARAASVVRFLQEQANIKPERLTASGYSFHRPIAANDTEETRSQNRRIEIILVPIR